MYTQPAHRKDITMKFSCTLAEKRYLAVCAKKAGQSVSLYLHEMMLQGYPDRPKSLPAEIQIAIGELMQVAALLHPFSRRRLDGEDFNALERAQAKAVIREVETLIQQIKNSYYDRDCTDKPVVPA